MAVTKTENVLLGENIVVRVEGDKIILEIDRTQILGSSGSGKSLIVATTRGNALVPGTDLTLGLNLYKKNA